MIGKLAQWLDNRTGGRKLIREALYENVPGGARWRYVWGSTLTFAFAVQMITGIFLWMAYSPSAHTAWESVFYIQYEMTGGWLLRGIHHYTAHAMTILLVLHLMQVVMDGAFKAPREVNFWTGAVLLLLVLGMSLTGYLLPWDQKGYWATNVATKLMGIVPIVGPAFMKILVGGAEYGHHTLTRFFALHAGVFPAMVVALIVGHIYLFRRHGLTSKKPHRKPDAAFWPDQMLRDLVACLAVLAAVLLLVVRHRLFDSEGPLGAELGAPADPSEPYSAARPDWYFLFLFQMLKYFHGEWGEIIGALILPGLAVGILFSLPILGRWRWGNQFILVFMGLMISVIVYLTFAAAYQDKTDPEYQKAVQEAHRRADRVKALARSPMGIPASGAVTLLREDPLIQGPVIFARNCASCHRYDGHDGQGGVPEDEQSAPDLKGFASRDWLRELLHPERFRSGKFFGGTAFHDGKMAKWLDRNIAELDEEERAAFDKLIMGLSAEAQLPLQKEIDERDRALVLEGKTLIEDDFGCIDCHEYLIEDPEATAPLLTGYGSREWLIRFINNPSHPKLYGDKNDRMPLFGEEEILNDQSIGLVADWLRGDWYRPEETAEAD